jgi:F-type H+-transporting ATPase subunit epsilon
VPLEVHVVTPERELWSGSASLVVARGVDGEVGIQSGHAPLLVRLAIGALHVHRPDEPNLVAVIDGGFMHVTSTGMDSRVDVMASHAELVGEIDVDAARARAEAAREVIAEGDGGSEEGVAEIDEAKADLAKAEARIDLAG